MHGRIPPVKSISRSFLAIKAIRELGPRQLGFFGLYKLGLRLGYFKRKTQISGCRTQGQSDYSSLNTDRLLDLPDPADIIEVIGQAGLSNLIAEAEEILKKEIRLFGGKPVPLRLTLDGTLAHWTNYEIGNAQLSKTQISGLPAEDIKFIWEPARFGWALTLARAYYLTKDERYPEVFWRYFDEFQRANPNNLGPNWVSAQEVALRILSFVFCGHIFADSWHSNAERKTCLALSVASHAQRILPTLIYARAQNNNHLLSEAAGLITASLALPEHPNAKKWRKSGWKWFNLGLETQIASDGAYIQHSTNYHRLMLQLALWILAIQETRGMANRPKPELGSMQSGRWHISSRAVANLKRATEWLFALTDPVTGQVPNLGPNDSAYILPLTASPCHDYRPVVQASSRVFWDAPAFKSGAWDDMGLWLGEPSAVHCHPVPPNSHQGKPTIESGVLKHPNGKSWVYLRAENFKDRPGHADQLHVDLWWHGLNVAQDAGTYLYNADPPWDNKLTHTAVHNTVMVDGVEQMTRVGRFLYLDRALGEIVSHKRAEDGSWDRLRGRHDGYSGLGILHERTVTAHQGDCWVIEDFIQAVDASALKNPHTIRLHWLLPDWEYERLAGEPGLRILSPYGWISLVVSGLGADETSISNLRSSVVRAGELIQGTDPISPTWGWVSPTYGVKIPAISFAVTFEGLLPLTFVSEWQFPEG